MAIIIDTSCLIILSKIGRLDLLERLFKDLLIPRAVHEEFGESLPAFIKVHPGVSAEKLIQLATAFLDRGEAEVIVLALETNAEGVIIDEKKGRKAAKAMGLKVMGTLGVLALGYIKGMVEDMEETIIEIKEKGFFVSENHLEEIRNYITKMSPAKTTK